MMKQEFEQLTGFYTTAEHYDAIEEAYYNFGGSKQEFCKAYKENKDGIAEKIAHKVTIDRLLKDQESEKRFESYSRDMISAVEKLKKQLEREQEWQPHEYRENAKQADYERLAEAGARELSDSEAVEMLADWWGFQPDKIKIIKTVAKIEKNRHNACRKCGEYERKPLYESTDWNYIRFDCGMMTYEMINGELSFFVH